MLWLLLLAAAAAVASGTRTPDLSGAAKLSNADAGYILSSRGFGTAAPGRKPSIQDMINEFQKRWNEVRDSREEAETFFSEMGKSEAQTIAILGSSMKSLNEDGKLDGKTSDAIRKIA